MRLRPGVPVLIREPGHMQVGIARPLGLANLSAEEQRFVTSLEQRVTETTSRENATFAHLLELIKAHGFAAPRDSRGPLPGSLVRIRGVDSVTSVAALALVAEGLGALAASDRRPATPGTRGAAAALSRGAGLARAATDKQPRLRTASEHEPATLEILSTSGSPAVEATFDLMARDTPHLLIVSDEKSIHVGPLVVPGSTACARCLALTRAEADPWWPRLAIQLSDQRRQPQLPADAAAIAGGIAARVALDYLTMGTSDGTRWGVSSRPARPPVPRSSSASSGETLYSAATRPHPDCGCGATDDPAALHAPVP